MKNALVADIFQSVAQLLEILGENPFRIRAYTRAAEAIASWPNDVADLVNSQGLSGIPGIGKDLADKIKEIVLTGHCQMLDELKTKVPQGVVDMLQIPSVGPKTVKLFFETGKLTSVDQLEKAAREGHLLVLPGIKQKTVDNILQGIDLLKKGRERMDLLKATTIAQRFIQDLSSLKTVRQIVTAGSLRRARETVRDIDLLAESQSPDNVIARFSTSPSVNRVLSQGETKSSVVTEEGVQVDLRVLPSEQFGAALLYFTGSKNHNIKLRQLAIKKKLKLNEYGLFDTQERCLASRTEQEIYRTLGLDWIPPELREDTGEIESAACHALPDLVELNDIRGDFHAHTNYSDGTATVEEMAQAAAALGYEYLCVSDHSVSLKVANGLDEKRLAQKRKDIARANKVRRTLRVLFGSEVEIDAEGKIDYPDEILSQFDIVVAAVHSGFRQTKAQLTRRIIRACENKHVHIIAHPTGRLWPTRPSYEVDFEEICKAARQTGTALEINGHPYRMDLSDILARQAVESGVRVAINTDAHAPDQLACMTFGVGLARRAWIPADRVLNTLTFKQVKEALKK
jgi:DNA polymerase (family 10)